MEFKVVRILDEYRIIINAGFKNGITVNDVFEIHGVVDAIYDPDTKELLGTLNGIKAQVKVAQVHEKMSVCKNVVEISPIQTLIYEGLTGGRGLSQFMSTPQKLNVDKSQITNPELYEPIQIGDKAVLIIKPKTSTPEIQDTSSADQTEKNQVDQCLPEIQPKE